MSESTVEADPYVGARVTRVRPMTDDELEQNGWEHAPDHHRPPVVVLDTGARIYPSRDPEGNGPGALFGVEPDGAHVFFPGTEADDE